jgi:protein involved in polysaccharide export with SLBB domain
MSDPKYGVGSGVWSPGPARCRSKISLRTVRQLGFFLVMPLLVATASAQQQPSTPSGYPDSSQTSTNPDCSDPVLASSADCTGQDQGNGQQQLNGNPQSGAGVPRTFGGQAPNSNNNYTDTGQQNSRQGQQNGANSQQQLLLPPEPLTEFQKFIASTTSQILPIYGANLFRRVPSTFAPLNMTPVPSDYVIGPGDELRVRVWGQVNFQANLQVDRAGEVYLPQVGPTHVAGMPFSELDGHLRQAIGRVYRNFDLTADIGQIRAIQVYVAGQARRPGVYTVSSLSTLVDAVFASGGPSIQGSMRHIELRRGSDVVTDFDLYGLLVHGDKSKDVKLLPGDVIFIPAVGAEVAITGSVRTPAIYELREGESLDGLIADAGGVSAVAAEARVSIERISEHHDRFAMEVAYDAKGLKTPLADGDLVHVYSIVPLYQKTVTLRGNIANPGRFAWHAGMRVSELIPDKDSLITRNYWWKRAQLGLPAPEFEPIPYFSNMRQPTDGNPVTLRPRSQGGTNGSNGYGQQGQYGSQQNPYGNANGVAGNGSNNAAGTRDNQDGLAQDQIGQNADGSQQGQYGSQQNQRLNAQQRGSNSSLAAQQSDNSNGPAPAQRTQVQKIAPEIDWDYAVIQRQDTNTLKTTLISFDLGKLVLDHDSSQDMELQAGDVVSIFSEADIRVPIAQQTKLVTLSGEFVHSGVYSVQPGETFHHLVERAGGLTPNAYLYGSEYTRESTRAMQQARIDEYVQNLSMEIQRSNMAVAASGTGSPQDAAADLSAQTNEQNLLTNLRQIRATGRIVLTFVPTSSGTVSLPEISMEDGDHFSVPSVPATVNVVGAVYDQNSFLYATGRRVGEYLGLAGGPNRDADYKHSFLIRADGEVVSSNLGKGLWAEKFKNLRVYPGDTIVVPEKTYKPGTLRTVLAYSQLFSSLALGAAALTIIQ